MDDFGTHDSIDFGGSFTPSPIDPTWVEIRTKKISDSKREKSLEEDEIFLFLWACFG